MHGNSLNCDTSFLTQDECTFTVCIENMCYVCMYWMYLVYCMLKIFCRSKSDPAVTATGQVDRANAAIPARMSRSETVSST